MQPLRIALPSKGRMAAAVHQLFGDAGMHLDNIDPQSALLSSIDERYEVMFVRAKDIPAFVADGVADLGVTGRDLVCESGLALDDLLDLGVGRARLVLAARETAGFASLADLTGELRVATTFPNLARAYLEGRGLSVEIVRLSGATEIAPHLGLADVIVDVVATGSTLKRNGLVELETILASSARLLAPSRQPALEPLIMLLDSVVQARARRYVMANIPAAALARVAAVLPGVERPTVMPLLGTDSVFAVHAIVDETCLDRAMADLRDLGGTGIVVTSMERLVR
ncbi:MAG: ATP phosphoribosyltransferase [Mycobacteriales bacterium]